MTADDVLKTLGKSADPVQAGHKARFFKTGIGEYGEGDHFLGIRVPVLRALAQEHEALSLSECRRLLRSSLHEARLLALLILVRQFQGGGDKHQTRIFQLYMQSTKYINNWDLVDSSAHPIAGAYLARRDRRPLYALAASESLWERRIAMVATWHFIRNNQFEDTLRIAENLLNDDRDLIQKAVGWMLREVGKRDLEAEESFLRRHYRQMPRTMLRYAIEKFPEPKRQRYLKGEM